MPPHKSSKAPRIKALIAVFSSALIVSIDGVVLLGVQAIKYRLNAAIPNIDFNIISVLPKIGPLEGIIDIKKLGKRIENMFLKKIGKEKTNANIECVRRAYQEVRGI